MRQALKERARGERESVGEKQRAGEGGVNCRPEELERERESYRWGGVEEEEGTAKRGESNGEREREREERGEGTSVSERGGTL
ncbi:hypothetical protein GW17_00006073 [Ensete ventricosum]|nr:hypothetical protein GW17_00006073 [Ensete ventricosum]